MVTLHGGPVRLSPVRATPCLFYHILFFRGCSRKFLRTGTSKWQQQRGHEVEVLKALNRDTKSIKDMGDGDGVSILWPTGVWRIGVSSPSEVWGGARPKTIFIGSEGKKAFVDRHFNECHVTGLAATWYPKQVFCPGGRNLERQQPECRSGPKIFTGTAYRYVSAPLHPTCSNIWHVVSEFWAVSRCSVGCRQRTVCSDLVATDSAHCAVEHDLRVCVCESSTVVWQRSTEWPTTSAAWHVQPRHCTEYICQTTHAWVRDFVFTSLTEDDGRLCFRRLRQYVGIYIDIGIYVCEQLPGANSCPIVTKLSQSYPWPQGTRWLNFGRPKVKVGWGGMRSTERPSGFI